MPNTARLDTINLCTFPTEGLCDVYAALAAQAALLDNAPGYHMERMRAADLRWLADAVLSEIAGRAD